jgi:hypothetical protein
LKPVSTPQPILDDVGRPVEHRKDAPGFGRGATHRLSEADAQNPVLAELTGVGIAGEIDRLQMAYLVAPQAPSVRGLEHHRIPIRRQPSLSVGTGEAYDLIIGVVEEVL